MPKDNPLSQVVHKKAHGIVDSTKIEDCAAIHAQAHTKQRSAIQRKQNTKLYSGRENSIPTAVRRLLQSTQRGHRTRHNHPALRQRACDRRRCCDPGVKDGSPLSGWRRIQLSCGVQARHNRPRARRHRDAFGCIRLRDGARFRRPTQRPPLPFKLPAHG